jgi:lipopolysaccharide transport system ATP-binding protein
MSDVVIRVENLTKEYRLGTINHGTLAQDLQSWWARLRSKEDPNSLITSPVIHHNAQLNPHFLALDSVSFEVKRGEAVGIIGRNGAGKSTLLKILSRVTAPTKGEVKIRGRVASLLEVGTGFHAELTGRENIFLNGAILGMRRTEISRKLDEIVAFAEVEKFIDTPVKRYSSGMYVRLAFAVAAHLEPEILIIDEVLAVGDAQFQKKCLGKMGDVATKEGRTILFVSHNMSAIADLCAKAIYLESGMIKKFGSTDAVIPMYLESSTTAKYNGIYINCYANDDSSWRKSTIIAIEIAWDRYRFQPGWECDIACYTIDGIKVFAIESKKLDGFDSRDREVNSITFLIENIGFAERDLRIDVGIRKGPKEPYELIINDGAIIRSEGSSLGKLRRSDVIVVPNVTCRMSVK